MPQQRVQATAERPVESRRRIDLSVAQVAASALAAVVGAVLASELGVYGTIIGAAVVSVGATTGGAILQHVFRRTGEQLRNAVTADPEPSHPQSLTGEISSDWNEPQTVRAKRRWTWRTYAAVSGPVFALAMTPILIVEAATGRTMHGITTGESSSGTSLTPGGSKPSPPPSDEPSGTASSGSASPTPSSTPSNSPSGTPSTSPSSTPSNSPSSTPSGTPTGTPTGGTSGDAATSPPPSAPSGTPTP